VTSPRVHNETDFVAEPHVLLDRDGEKLCAIVKATFELRPGPPKGPDGSFAIAPKARRRGIRAADVPWDKPEVSSIRYPSDLYVRKPGAEIIVVAQAHAPGGKAVPRFEAGVRVGALSKVVSVTGPRRFLPDDGGVTEPEPTNAVPMRYELAFGGSDASDPERFVEDARNPIGRGVASHPNKLEGKPAPQIEDPKDPVGAPSKRPKPAGLGPVGRHWEPRRRLWGTYDASWLKRRAPLPPGDYDDRASFSAPEGLVSSAPLKGGEEGALINLTPGGGTLSFQLPRLRVAIVFRVKGREEERFAAPIDTLVLDTVAVPPPTIDRTGNTAWSSPLTIELVMRAFVGAPLRWSSGEIVIEERRK
jgi:hypothetical protein